MKTMLLIQSLFWDPVYLPWDSEAFRNAGGLSISTKGISEYLHFLGNGTRSNEEDERRENRFIDCKRD